MRGAHFPTTTVTLSPNVCACAHVCILHKVLVKFLAKKKIIGFRQHKDHLLHLFLKLGLRGHVRYRTFLPPKSIYLHAQISLASPASWDIKPSKYKSAAADYSHWMLLLLKSRRTPPPPQTHSILSTGLTFDAFSISLTKARSELWSTFTTEPGDGRIPLIDCWGGYFFFFCSIVLWKHQHSTGQDSPTHPKCVAIYILQ